MKRTEQISRIDISKARQLDVDVSRVQPNDPNPTLNRVCAELDMNRSSCSGSPRMPLPSTQLTRSRRDKYNDIARARETKLGSQANLGIQVTVTPDSTAASAADRLQNGLTLVAFMGGIITLIIFVILAACFCSRRYQHPQVKEQKAAKKRVKKPREPPENREQRAAREWESAGREFSVEERRSRMRMGSRSRNGEEALADDIEMAYINQV